MPVCFLILSNLLHLELYTIVVVKTIILHLSHLELYKIAKNIVKMCDSVAIRVVCQQQHYNKGWLTEEQIKQLQELDFVFNAVFYKWCKRFEEYKDFVKETGIFLPKTDVIHNGNNVGKWVNGQRTERKKGKLNPTYEKMLLEYNPHFFEKRD